jgi:hypothetical protein
MDERTIIPDGSSPLDKLCPDLANWPKLWEIDHGDLAIGQRIVKSIQPFVLDLLQQGLTDKTLARHRDHLQMLGGEIVRRHYEDTDLAKQSARQLLLTFVDDDGGPLMWPRITESAQNAFDATCRKLYRFLNQQKNHR